MHNDDIVLIQRETLRFLDEDRLREALDFMYSEGERSMMEDLFSPLQNILSQVADLRQQLVAVYDGIAQGHPVSADSLMPLLEQAYELTDRLSGDDVCRRPEYYPQLIDTTQPLHVRCFLMSQLMFHLLEHFDADLYEGLYLLTLDDQPVQLRARAWVTIALVALQHSARLRCLPRLQEQLSYIAETMHEGRREDNVLLTLQLLLLQCTDAIRAKELLHTTIHNMVMDYAQKHGPESMGNALHAQDSKDGKQKVMTIAINLNDDSSDWLKTPEGKQIRKKMMEYVELIGSGVDAQLGEFEIAARLPFFQGHPEHWLTPFTLDHPEVQRILHQRPELQSLVQTIYRSERCDTDKFAHLMMATHLNNDLFGMIQSIEQKLHELTSQEEVPALDEETQPTLQQAMRSYVHDLFRYCLLSGEVSVVVSPFRHGSPLFLRCRWLQASIDLPEEMHSVGRYLSLSGNNFCALEVYEHLLEQTPTRENIHGWVQSLLIGNIPIDEIRLGRLYQYAHLYPEEDWLQLALADALLELDRYHEAELVLSEAVLRWPDNYDIHQRLADTLIELGRYRDALEHLFRCEFMREGDIMTMRRLALAMLMLRRLNEASKYLATVQEQGYEEKNDLILAGHICLVRGEIQEAVSHYRKAYYKARREKQGSKIQTFSQTIFSQPFDLAPLALDSLYLAVARDTLYNSLKRKKKK